MFSPCSFLSEPETLSLSTPCPPAPACCLGPVPLVVLELVPRMAGAQGSGWGRGRGDRGTWAPSKLQLLRAPTRTRLTQPPETHAHARSAAGEPRGAYFSKTHRVINTDSRGNSL